MPTSRRGALRTLTLGSIALGLILSTTALGGVLSTDTASATEDTTTTLTNTTDGTTGNTTTLDTETTLDGTLADGNGSRLDPNATRTPTTSGDPANATGGDPCWPGETAGVVVCQLPPVCRTVLEGAPECDPPKPCTDRGDGTIRCLVDGEDARTRTDATVQTDPTRLRRAQLAMLDAARTEMAALRAQIDELRERYRAGISDLEDRYAEGKADLRERYEACLASEEPPTRCREQARAALADLRERLRAEGQALLQRLLDEADRAVDRTCDRILQQQTTTLVDHGLGHPALDHVAPWDRLGPCELSEDGTAGPVGSLTQGGSS